MKRKLTSVVLSLAIIISMIPTASFAAISNIQTEVNGRVNIAGVDCYNLHFDFEDLTTARNTVYSDELSVLSILLSSDFGAKGTIFFTDDDSYLLEQLGFGDIKRINLKNKYQDIDTNDFVEFYMGRKTIRINLRNYVIYAVAVRGTYEAAEWMSNFDLGARTKEFEEMCGSEHPDWDDSNLHKGFCVTANRVYKEINQYIDNHRIQDFGKTKSILLTGHSRGAAVANLLGKKFEDDYNSNGRIKPYTYTFGTPSVTQEKSTKARQYKTIFNMINDDDIVPYVPLEQWGFRRYGKDIHVSVDEQYRKEWKSDNMSLLYNAYVNGMGGELSDDPTIMQLFSSIADGRMYDTDDYVSANGSRAKEYLPGIISAQSLERSMEYEFNDIVWIPNNVADDYAKYYVDLPYGQLRGESVLNLVDKAKFEGFEKITKCKRVKVSPMFMLCTVAKIYKQVTEALGQMTVSKIRGLIDYIVKNEGRIPTDESFYKELLEKCELDNDILNLLCMTLITYDRDIESGPVFVKSLIDAVKLNVVDGFLWSHMPTTYYFIASQGTERKDIRPHFMKVRIGDSFEFSNNVYMITSVLNRTVSLVKAGNAPIVVIPDTVNIEGETYNVTGLGAKSFVESEAKAVLVESKGLTKSEVRFAFRDSDVNKVIIMVGDVVQNLKYLKKYEDIFKESIVGKKITLVTNNKEDTL